MTEKKAPVDLAQFDTAVQKQDEGILVPILGMDNRTSLGFSIRVAGPDSARAKAAQEALADELIEQQNMSQLSAAQIAERSVRYVAKVTMGWEPNVVLDGQQLAYTEENAAKLYVRFNFIKEQVDRAGGSRARFTKG